MPGKLAIHALAEALFQQLTTAASSGCDILDLKPAAGCLSEVAAAFTRSPCDLTVGWNWQDGEDTAMSYTLRVSP